MRRIAWFRIVVDADDELVAQAWLTTVNAMLQSCAEQTAEATDGRVKLVEDMESGQTFALPEQEVRDREDV